MIGLFIIGVLLIFFAFLLRWYDVAGFDVALGALGGACCGICMVFSDNTPTALDVYQGKTTLEITYRDSVAVDSVVVFKKD